MNARDCKHGAQIGKCELCQALHDLESVITAVDEGLTVDDIQLAIRSIEETYTALDEARRENERLKRMLVRVQAITNQAVIYSIGKPAVEEFVEWVEPYGPGDEPVYMRASRSTVIAVAKAVAARKGRSYESDERALDDFMAVHWATPAPANKEVKS